MSETGLDGGFTLIDNSVNSVLDLFASSDSRLRPTGPSIMADSHLRGWTDASAGTPFSMALDGSTSMVNLQGHSTRNQATTTDSAGFGGSTGIGMWNEMLPELANNRLLLGNGVSWTMSSNNCEQPTVSNDFVDFCMQELHYDAQNHTLPLMVGRQNQLSGAPWSHMNPPSSGLESLIQIEEDWNLGLQGQGVNDLVTPLLSNQLPNNASCMAYNSLSMVEDSSLRGYNLDTLAAPAEAVQMLESPNINAQPTGFFSDVIKYKGKKGFKEKMPKGTGGQRKRRGPVAREKTARVRAMSACVSCFLSRTACSATDGVCSRCLRRQAPESPIPNCIRGHLEDYSGAFFDPFLVGHLSPCATADWMRNNVQFTPNWIVAELSSGPYCQSISLPVFEFRPIYHDTLLISDLTSRTNDNMLTFATTPTLAYGLFNFDIDQLKRQCQSYFKAISIYPQSPSEIISENTSPILSKAFKAIHHFQHVTSTARGNDLLRKAIMLYFMEVSMTQKFAFSEASARKAIGSLQNLSKVPPSEQSISARLLNRQIKVAVNLLLEGYTKYVLKELGREMKNKTRRSWTLCFCIILIVAMCIDQRQIAIDGLVIEKISQPGADPALLHKMGVEICQRMEGLPIYHSCSLFNGIFKHYHPIRDGCPTDDFSGPNQAEIDLVNEFRQLISDHSTELSTLAKQPCLGGCSHTPAKHRDFRLSNCTRILSRVLMMQCEG